ENRAMEAAQQAISSPLLDNVSVSGATGVLVNITGGADLTPCEGHQINEIIHDAVGGDAQIIFRAGHAPALQGEIRVTVIATGFDRALSMGTARPTEVVTPQTVTKSTGAPVIQFPQTRPTRVAGGGASAVNRSTDATRTARPSLGERAPQDVTDMEIPTFIRRQMD